MAYCPKCGNKLPENAEFCGNCGTLLLQDKKNVSSVKPQKQQSNGPVEWYKNNIFTYKGRLNRWKYFKYCLLNMGLATVVSIIINIIVLLVKSPYVILIAFTLRVLVSLPISIGGWMLAVRRIHDLNFTGWLLLLPSLSCGILYCWGIILQSIGLIVVGGILGILFALVLLFCPGTKGPNQYGEDPLAKK